MNDTYGNLMPIGPQTRLFQSSVERQKRQAIELVQAQAEVVQVAEACRGALTAQALGQVSQLVSLGQQLTQMNPAAAPLYTMLIQAHAYSAANRIGRFQ